MWTRHERAVASIGHGTVELRHGTGHGTVAYCDICGWGGVGEEPTIDEKFPSFFHCAEKDYDVCCECAKEPRWSAKRTNARTDERIEAIVDALRAQMSALAPDAPLTAPAVVPFALSDADFMPEQIFGRGWDNDHEGNICYACVAEEWVVLVGVKVPRC